jgi:hypothetical protein
VVVFLMPVTYYPTYGATAADPSVSAYWQHLTALPFWPCGPQWFLWQLLALNVLAAGLHRFAPGWTERLGSLAASARAHPIRFFGALVSVSALAYAPLALAYSPWEWTSYGPFSFQVSRALHYPVYFFAGCAVGAYGLDRGLLAIDGSLARHWAGWLAASVAGFVLWALPTSQMVDGAQAPLLVQIAAALGFVVACASGCFVLMALCLRFAPNGREFSTVFRSMPTACISCTTSLSSGCNTRCCPSACSRSARPRSCLAEPGLDLGGRRGLRQCVLGQSSRPGQAMGGSELQRTGAGQTGQAGRFARMTFPGQMRAG